MQPFNPNLSGFTRAMASGHKRRKGHTLTGYYVDTTTAGVRQLVKTCCPVESEAK